MVLKVFSLNVTDIINREVDLFKAFASKRQIKLSFSCEETLFCKINPSAFERVITNLLDNSIKYIQEEGQIDLALTQNDSELLLSVKDNGPGIPKEHQKNIFMPYYQLSHKKSNIQGLGIGLSIVKQIIDSVGGSIHIDSSLGRGTTVQIKLPKYILSEKDVVTSYIPQKPIMKSICKTLPKSKYDEKKYTLLFVEDNTDLIHSIHGSMTEFFNIYYALDGQEALDK